jgi:putative membrane protein
MTLAELLPTLNACLNGAAFLCLAAGFVAIRRKRPDVHRALMIAAFSLSVVFLVSYLTRFYLTGTTRFPGEGWAKATYLTILFTHMPLAAVVVPLCLRALYLAFKQRFAEHRRVVKWLYPIWSYVSVTGVVVYLMLYHWPHALPEVPPVAGIEVAR